jgi:hypothetical protein
MALVDHASAIAVAAIAAASTCDSDFASDAILRLVAVAPGYDGGSRFLRGVIAWAAGRAP